MQEIRSMHNVVWCQKCFYYQYLYVSGQQDSRTRLRQHILLLKWLVAGLVVNS